MVRRSFPLVALAALLLAAPARAQLEPALPRLLLGDESVATTDDARALLLNPAATGLRYPAELYVDGLHFGGANAISGMLTVGGLGLQVRRSGASFLERGLSAAAGSERLRLGATGYWTSQAPGPAESFSAEHHFDARIGALSRPTPWLSAGATLDHLEQPVIADVRTRREYTLGLGLRPLAANRASAATLGTRLTLSADVRMTEAAPRRFARAWFGAELEPIPGLALQAMAAGHRELRIGIVLRGVNASIGSARHTIDSRELQHDFAVSLHGGEERTAFVLPARRRVAVVHAGGVLADEALGDGALGGGAGTTPSAPLHRQLERALDDPLTRGVLLELHGVGGMAQIEELRPRIARLRAAGKPVVAYLEEGGRRSDLYLASACDRIVASEAAEFMGLGLRVERRYWREALARAGIRIERSSTGRYKSAYRNFSVDSMPPADSAVVLRDLEVRQQLFVDAVAHDRKLAPETLERYLDGRPWSSAELSEGGVIDSVGYRDDALRILGRLAHMGDSPRRASLARRPLAQREWTRPSPIAVVYTGGDIEPGRSGGDLLNGAVMGSATVIRQLERAFHAPGVRVVVMRVESPGGSALASNLIDHAVQKLKAETKKPFLVSMGSVAGSGGYYIACHGDRIFADRNTRTGSIGVLTVQPSFAGLYEKLHAHSVEFDRGDYMPGTSWSHDWTPREQAAADSAIGRLYRDFVGKVADGRHMSFEQVHAVAQGRVWAGDDAKAHGLVDEIGGLEDALREARRRAGVPMDEKITLFEQGHPRGSLIERFVGGWVRETLAREARLPAFGEAQAIDPEAFGLDDE
jgi:protease-4